MLGGRRLVRRLVQLYLGLYLFGASMALLTVLVVGTVLYAVGIGPLAHFFIPRFSVPVAAESPGPARGSITKQTGIDHEESPDVRD